jgi:hypothetical protein
MSFQTGLSGLNAASKSLDVIGNNIANANTVGMKSSRAEFADLVASSIGSGGGGGSTAGIGVAVATVSQQFTQGNINVTGNNLDVAINGGGFFHENRWFIGLHARWPVQTGQGWQHHHQYRCQCHGLQNRSARETDQHYARQNDGAYRRAHCSQCHHNDHS